MGDNIYLGDRNGVRTPMQWSGDRNAGFSRADPQALYLPLVIDPVYGYQAVNVEAQRRMPTSLLNWMRRLIAIRKRYQAFGRGTIEFLDPTNQAILAYMRWYEGADASWSSTTCRASSSPSSWTCARSRAACPSSCSAKPSSPESAASSPTYSASGRTPSTGFDWNVAAHNWRHAARAAAALDQAGRARA